MIIPKGSRGEEQEQEMCRFEKGNENLAIFIKSG
jgi:hypothetical protein